MRGENYEKKEQEVEQELPSSGAGVVYDSRNERLRIGKGNRLMFCSWNKYVKCFSICWIKRYSCVSSYSIYIIIHKSRLWGYY